MNSGCRVYNKSLLLLRKALPVGISVGFFSHFHLGALEDSDA